MGSALSRVKRPTAAAPATRHAGFEAIAMNQDNSPPSNIFQALVLAGDRSSDDPLLKSARVCCKALVPVAGRPMVLRVLEALGNSEWVSQCSLSGPPRQALEQSPELKAGIDSRAWRWSPGLKTPSSSADQALQKISSTDPVLVTTADHALLNHEIVDYFCAAAVHSGLDLLAALVPYPEVAAAHPGIRRTGLRFRDGTYCSCNLFAFMNPEARKVAGLWRQVEQDRKHPWRVMRLLGWPAVLRYLLRRLTLERALHSLSRQLGIRAGSILLPFPDAAVDVDTQDDWQYVARLAEQRSRQLP